MKLFSGSRGNWTPVVIGVLIFLCSLIVTGIRTYQEYVIHKKAKTKELINAANEKKEALESKLRDADEATSILSYFASKHGITPEIDEVAGKILEANKSVDMLGLVEGEVLTRVYPMKGNEGALGYHIFKTQPRLKAAFDSLKNDESYAAARYDLMPFGEDVLERRSIYIHGRHYGFAIAVIRPALLFRDPGPHPDYQFQISHTDSYTGREHFYLPSSNAFHKASALTMSIRDGDWKIYVKPAKSDTLYTLLPFIFFSVLLSSVAGLITWYVTMQPYELKKLVDERTHLMGVSEGKYQSLFEQASDAILVHDLEMNIIKVNNAMTRLFGYSSQELLQMKTYDLFKPEELVKEPLHLTEVIEGEQIINNRLMLRSDDTTIEVETNAKRVGDDMIMVILRDVTDLRKAERQIAHSEITLRNAFEYSAIGMAIVSLEGNWVRVNRELCYILGYSEKELLTMTAHELTHPDDLVDGLEFMSRGRSSTLDRYNVEKRYIHKNGAIVWVNLNANVVKNDAGEPLHFVMQIEDITKKKESELNFRLLVEKSLVGVYIIQDGKFAYVNPRLAEIFGYSQEELVDTVPTMNVVHPEDVHIVEEFARKRTEDGVQAVHYEVKGQKKDGGLLWIEVFSSATTYKGAEAAIGTLKDITERKQSEHIILHEKNLSEAIINGLPGIFYISEKDGDMLRWNKNLEIISGYDSDEIGAMRITDFVEERHIEFAKNKRAEAFANSKANYEIKVVTKDGQELIYYITIMPVSYNNRDCIMGIGIDYTEKKASEMVLIMKNAEIKERVKELQCLYRLSEISNDPSYSMGGLMREYLRIIPASYQYPEIACAQITSGGVVYTSENFAASEWKQEAAITTNGRESGMITVYYTEEKPIEAEGPFLAEERSLIDSIADILSNAIGWRALNA